MDLIDIIATPFYFIVLWLYANIYRARSKNDFLTQKYFISASFLRVLGGIAFGCVYFFYYGGGDTLNYHHDSMIISHVLRTDPLVGFKLMFSDLKTYDPQTYPYVLQMIFKYDLPSNYMSSIAAIINIFTLDSFVCTTIVFSIIGFWGNWQLFRTLCKLFPTIHRELAIACLYLPSILFWTSGIMKDTLCTAALCFLFTTIIDFFIFNKRSVKMIFIVVVSVWLLYVLKIYILLCFIPTVSIYIFSIINNQVRNIAFRQIIKPFFYAVAIGLAYLAIVVVSEGNSKYSLETIQNTAQVTAQYIGRISLKTGGSFYSLGKLDFSPSNIPLLALKAFNVTFYRPYVWEITSPLMVFSVMEGIYFTYLSYRFLMYVIRVKKFRNVFTPFTSFCFTFAVIFSFVVGTTSNNFGALARYKSVMLPFFACGIYATIKEHSFNRANAPAPAAKQTVTI